MIHKSAPLRCVDSSSGTYGYCAPRKLVDFDLVIPALNEERRIGHTILELCAFLNTVPFSSRLIVVDNGSVDATAEAVDVAGVSGLPWEVIGCRRRGKGAAVRAGVLYSNARYVAYCDADLSTPPAAILDAFKLLEDGWDAVIGSRRCVGAEYAVAQPLLRRLGSKAFGVVAGKLAGGVSDTQCGFKAFTAEAAKQIFPHVVTDGFAFDVEVIARIKRTGHSAIELPISWSHQEGSSFRLVYDGIHAFGDLLAARHALQLATR